MKPHAKWNKTYYEKKPWAKTYVSIKGRCERKTDTGYRLYGAKGIKCLMTMGDLKFLWNRDSAENMKRPSIDRIDSKGDYTIENCRYIELSENCARPFRKHVLRINEDGTTTEFESITDADTHMSASLGYVGRRNYIYMFLSGRKKHAYGFQWKLKAKKALNRKEEL